MAALALAWKGLAHNTIKQVEKDMKCAGYMRNAHIGFKQAAAFLNKGFPPAPPCVSTPREAEQKFFGSFFQKRTSCFLGSFRWL
jgi:hypothetical protein